MKDENGKVIFDADEQAKVDEIVKERLARHKPEDYDDLKEIADEVGEFFEGATPSEKKAAIKVYKEQLKQQRELAELEEQSKTTGRDPELLKEISDLKKEIAESKKYIDEIKGERKAKTEAEKAKQAQEESWNKQVIEFECTYEDIDLSVLEKDEDFIEYATGRTGTLTTLYEGYVKFTSKLEKKTADEIRAKYKSKELLSTGTGKGSKVDSTDYGLTENQKSLAKANNMSYKDYADLLKYA